MRRRGPFVLSTLLMQKLYNLSGCLGFLMSSGLVIATIIAFARVPGMIEDYADSMTEDITGKVTEMVPSQIDEAMPELPTSTGPVIPFK